jgi:hypothetical protein
MQDSQTSIEIRTLYTMRLAVAAASVRAMPGEPG